MLIDVPVKTYRQYFHTDPHPYVSENFISLNKHKADRIVRLIENDERVSIGIIAGIKDNTFYSPFSAPFGGFHFISNEIRTGEISEYIDDLRTFLIDQKLQKFKLVLPPNMYHHSMNAKFVNTFIRSGFEMALPDISNYIDLKTFDGTWVKKRVAERCQFAERNNLSFHYLTDDKMKMDAYEIIVINRTQFDRKIYMTYNDLMDVDTIMPVDFFMVKDRTGENVGSAVCYRGHESIVQAIFWGDTQVGRKLGTMDFLVKYLFKHYKELGFDFIDIGISTEDGIPNEGLIRFKESHNCTSCLKFSFSLNLPE